MDDVREFLGIAFNRYWVIVGAIALAAIVAIYYGYTLTRKARKSDEDNPQGGGR
jgi:hypothetical protein